MKERILKEDISYFADTFPFSAALEGKTIAVTGATGLLGACMVRCLLALRTEKGINLHVVAVVRNVQKAERMFGQVSDEISYYSYDFSCVEPFAPTKKIDYLFHFAAPTASKDFVEYPVETMNTVYGGMQKPIVLRSSAWSNFDGVSLNVRSLWYCH